MTTTTRDKLAELLLEIGAVSLSPDHPYTWSSGIQSPIYCDNRLLMAYPNERKQVIQAFCKAIEDMELTIDVIAGTSTAGIPHAAWISETLNLPMAYIRGSAKGHGKQNRIEGRINKGDRVLIIEDLISTGGSSIEAAESVREAGGIVTDILAIFSYNLQRSNELAKEKSIGIHTLTDFDALIESASAKGDLTSDQLKSLREWKRNPAGWK
ncbi:orotate phosphoribosyltransferase [Salisediminibacterium beveridgei]|uniref:Orotate phosphoribosyltransferase n=1 Tax=Salisediminibacterium beveridgei TaxID=632773 RepID=A0A1D7QWA0_9BACI|nr:orotate phosphoribosyltransferase [Salisediminibacterium beveridgei]AOM83249.1 Orotate phosphoribosyltransferase [Salisediminibacterium beveridgei]